MGISKKGSKGGKTWEHTYGGEKHKQVYDPNIDYFEKYTLVPQEIYTILLEEGELEDYQQTENLLQTLESKGWTFDYGLDNSPYGLRPVGTETNLYAKGGETEHLVITEKAERMVDEMDIDDESPIDHYQVESLAIQIAKDNNLPLLVKKIKYKFHSENVTVIKNQEDKERAYETAYDYLYDAQYGARGGLTKGKSHKEGGMPMTVKSTGQKIEVEGGEGIVNKHSMSSEKKYEYEGKEKTTCEIVSDLNQQQGDGVAFSCDTVESKKYKFMKGGKTKLEMDIFTPLAKENEKKVRDMMIGKKDKNGFSGLWIVDCSGGGNEQEFYFADGVDIEEELYVETNGDYDNDMMKERFIDKKGKDFYTAIHKTLDEFAKGGSTYADGGGTQGLVEIGALTYPTYNAIYVGSRNNLVGFDEDLFDEEKNKKIPLNQEVYVDEVFTDDDGYESIVVQYKDNYAKGGSTYADGGGTQGLVEIGALTYPTYNAIYVGSRNNLVGFDEDLFDEEKNKKIPLNQEVYVDEVFTDDDGYESIVVQYKDNYAKGGRVARTDKDGLPIYNLGIAIGGEYGQLSMSDAMANTMRDVFLENEGIIDKEKWDRTMKVMSPDWSKKWKDFKKNMEIEVKDGKYINPYQARGYAKGGSIDRDIAKFKKQLISKEKSRGLYENFGQKEVRKINDKYDAYERDDMGVQNATKIQEFSDWASGYDGTRYAKGGDTKNRFGELSFDDIEKWWGVDLFSLSEDEVDTELDALNKDWEALKERERVEILEEKDYAKGGKVDEAREDLIFILYSLDDDSYVHFMEKNGFEQLEVEGNDHQLREINSFMDGNNYTEKPLSKKDIKDYVKEIEYRIEIERYELYEDEDEDDDFSKGGKIMKTYDDFDRDYERFTHYVLDRIDLDERRKIREDWNRENKINDPANLLTASSKDEKRWENYLLKRVNEKSYAKGGYRANRPSPSMSATAFDVGEKMRGNDGNLWEIRANINGIHRWVKLSNYAKGGKVLSEDELWDMIERYNWDKDGNSERIGKKVNKLSTDEYKQLRGFAQVKHQQLNDMYKEEWLSDSFPWTGDDSWGDLRAEIVGRGKKFYNNMDSEKLREMAENRDYNENFLYSFQNHKAWDDYGSSDDLRNYEEKWYAKGGSVRQQETKRFEGYSDEELQIYNGDNEETLKYYDRKDAIDEAVETSLEEKDFAKGGLLKGITDGEPATENQILLLKRRLNNKEYKALDKETTEALDYVQDNEVRISPEQTKKGLDFLKNLWKTPTGKERKNNPFGHREQNALETFTHFTFDGFYDDYNGYRHYYIPIYGVEGDNGYFQYYYDGEVNIIGAKGKQLAKGGKVPTAEEIYDGEFLIDYPVDESYTCANCGDAEEWRYKGKRYVIVTWNERAEDHEPDSVQVEEMEDDEDYAKGGYIEITDEFVSEFMKKRFDWDYPPTHSYFKEWKERFENNDTRQMDAESLAIYQELKPKYKYAKGGKTETLYNVYYREETGERNYEGTTNNFEKWLLEHNTDRACDSSGIRCDDIKEMFSKFSHEDCSGYGDNEKIEKFLKTKGYSEDEVDSWWNDVLLESAHEFDVEEVSINKYKKGGEVANGNLQGDLQGRLMNYDELPTIYVSEEEELMPQGYILDIGEESYFYYDAETRDSDRIIASKVLESKYKDKYGRDYTVSMN